MKERDLGLSIFCHAVLVFAALLVGLPLYFAFVAGSLSIQEVQQTPFPWLPGRYFFANVVEAWNTGDFARSFANSMIVTTGIVVGKLAISLIAAYAVTIAATLALVAWSWLEMRLAERRRDAGRRK